MQVGVLWSRGPCPPPHLWPQGAWPLRTGPGDRVPAQPEPALRGSSSARAANRWPGTGARPWALVTAASSWCQPGLLWGCLRSPSVLWCHCTASVELPSALGLLAPPYAVQPLLEPLGVRRDPQRPQSARCFSGSLDCRRWDITLWSLMTPVPSLPPSLRPASSPSHLSGSFASCPL